MGSLSDYAELELLDHVFNAAYTPVATVYLGLSTADPLDTGAGLAEPVGNNYARAAITFGAYATRKVTQSGAVTFNTATGAWGTLTHWAVFDASSAGNMLAHGALGTSKSVINGNTPSVADAEVYVQIDAGYCSNYLAQKLLELMFRNVAYSKPATYVAVTTATIADSDTGSTITEPAGGSYARKQVNINGGASPTWDLAAAGLVDNTHAITMATATASWGTVVASAILDASTVGNLLVYDNGTADQAVGTDDVVEYAIGAWDITLS